MRPETAEIKVTLIVAKPKRAVGEQEALMAFARQKSLPVGDSQVSKTRRVLDHLIAKSTV